MIHASLFSGIGGPEVAAKMMGWENAFHCEINPFGRAVLDYWFPESKSYEDITKTSFKEWRGRIDVLTGGFPCQPFSYAGKRGGREDERYLWPEMLRVIDEVRPTWVVGENVAGITTMVEGGVCADLGGEATLFAEGDELHRYELDQSYTIERICKDLEHLGYSVQSVLVPAAAVGAPHRRDRVFIIAHDDVNHPDLGADYRPSGEDEGAEGEERLPERDNLHLVGDSSEVRSEGAGTDTDTICDGCKELGISGIHRGGDFSARDYAERETQGSTTDPDRTGREEPQFTGGSKNQEEGGAGVHDRVERFGLYGSASDSAGELRDGDGIGHGLQPRTGSMPELGDGDREGPSSDPSHISLQGGRDGLEQPEHRTAEQGEFGRGSGEDGVRTSADSHLQRFNERIHPAQSRKEERFNSEADREWGDTDRLLPEHRWDSFPTVSPVHRGNDGIPFPLDNLTIPQTRWRFESLKAYGNAILPQVMYRIFQAIEFAEANSKTDINF